MSRAAWLFAATILCAIANAWLQALNFCVLERPERGGRLSYRVSNLIAANRNFSYLALFKIPVISQ
jgi:hypothetical protein